MEVNVGFWLSGGTADSRCASGQQAFYRPGDGQLYPTVEPCGWCPTRTEEDRLGMRAMYTAPTVEAVESALEDLDARRGTQPVRADAGSARPIGGAASASLRSSPSGEGCVGNAGPPRSARIATLSGPLSRSHWLGSPTSGYPATRPNHAQANPRARASRWGQRRATAADEWRSPTP